MNSVLLVVVARNIMTFRRQTNKLGRGAEGAGARKLSGISRGVEVVWKGLLHKAAKEVTKAQFGSKFLKMKPMVDKILATMALLVSLMSVDIAKKTCSEVNDLKDEVSGLKVWVEKVEEEVKEV